MWVAKIVTTRHAILLRFPWAACNLTDQHAANPILVQQICFNSIITVQYWFENNGLVFLCTAKTTTINHIFTQTPCTWCNSICRLFFPSPWWYIWWEKAIRKLYRLITIALHRGMEHLLLASINSPDLPSFFFSTASKSTSENSLIFVKPAHLHIYYSGEYISWPRQWINLLGEYLYNISVFACDPVVYLYLTCYPGVYISKPRRRPKLATLTNMSAIPTVRMWIPKHWLS